MDHQVNGWLSPTSHSRFRAKGGGSLDPSSTPPPHLLTTLARSRGEDFAPLPSGETEGKGEAGARTCSSSSWAGLSGTEVMNSRCLARSNPLGHKVGRSRRTTAWWSPASYSRWVSSRDWHRSSDRRFLSIWKRPRITGSPPSCCGPPEVAKVLPLSDPDERHSQQVTALQTAFLWGSKHSSLRTTNTPKNTTTSETQAPDRVCQNS